MPKLTPGMMSFGMVVVLSAVVLADTSSASVVATGSKSRHHPASKSRRHPALAYAPAEVQDPQTWTIACGVGWLYGIGGCIGPFFGTGVGLTFPGGVIAGAGGGVGIMFGIGMGSGIVWGGGRGVVKGFGVNPPMKPPFADGLPRPSDLPSLAYLLRRVATEADNLRERVVQLRDDWDERRGIQRGDRNMD